MLGKAFLVALLSIAAALVSFDHYTGEKTAVALSKDMFRRVAAMTGMSTGLASTAAGSVRAVGAKVPVNEATSIHNFTIKNGRGEDYDMAELKGKAVLLMNVASQCGFTKSGYAAATTLYDKYNAQGFTVLAFPCNQFGGQEPGTDEEIKEFACTRFKAAFPLMKKVEVNGDNASPLWEFMKKEKTGLLSTKGIKWNFTSFLCDKDGKVLQRYPPGTSAETIEKDLIPLLVKSKL